MNVTVRRANVILTVPEEQKDEYLSKGYDIVDPRTFKVIDKAIPEDKNALRVMVEDLQKELKQLKEENAKLKEALATKEPELPEEPDYSSVVEEDDSEESEEIEASEEKEEETPEPEKEFTPINKRKSAKTKK